MTATFAASGHNALAQTSRNPEDWDFFEFPRAKLPRKRPVLSISSSSDDEEITSGIDTDDENPEKMSDDLFTKLQRQFSTLSVQTNFNTNNRPRPPHRVPGKYLLDETGRRWSLKSVVAVETLPRPKQQDGRSKIIEKSVQVRQTPLALWQNFMSDQFLVGHVLHWFNKKSSGTQKLEASAGKEKGKGKIGSQPQTMSLVDLDELKAFVAILYGWAASADATMPLEMAWNNDTFSSPFFIGTMRKETFFGLLKDFMALGQNEPQTPLPRESTSASVIINEFNYRLMQSFDPGDTLLVSDQSISLRTRTCQSALLSPSGITVLKTGTLSWLRDARCGFFFRVAPPVFNNLPNDMIVDMAQLHNANSSKRVVMDETLRRLVGQQPIAGSGRTVYVSPMHAGVDCASDMFEKHKLRFVGQLPSSGFYDSRVPFVAKSRTVLKRTIGSTLFLFDQPLTLISYQRLPALRPPDVLVSTAHHSKDKVAETVAQASAQNGHSPPSALLDYQRFFKGWPEPMSDFCSLFVDADALSSMPLERLIFFDCLYAAAYNAFVLWKLEDPSGKQNKTQSRDLEFRNFLKLLAVQLAKPYITRRLASHDDIDTAQCSSAAWRLAAKQILCNSEQSEQTSFKDDSPPTGAASAGSNPAGTVSSAADNGGRMIGPTKKQPKKKGKRQK